MNRLSRMLPRRRHRLIRYWWGHRLHDRDTRRAVVDPRAVQLIVDYYRPATRGRPPLNWHFNTSPRCLGNYNFA